VARAKKPTLAEAFGARRTTPTLAQAFATRGRSKRSLAALKGWETRRRPVKPYIRDVARDEGVEVALQTARKFEVHPDEWAVDVAYDFDLDAPDLYDDFFYPAEGSATW